MRGLATCLVLILSSPALAAGGHGGGGGFHGGGFHGAGGGGFGGARMGAGGFHGGFGGRAFSQPFAPGGLRGGFGGGGGRGFNLYRPNMGGTGVPLNAHPGGYPSHIPNQYNGFGAPRLGAATGFHSYSQFHGPVVGHPLPVPHNPQHSWGQWGHAHNHQHFVYWHNGHYFHRWYYGLGAAPGAFYWYDTPADFDLIDSVVDPLAYSLLGAAPQVTDFPDCDPELDECQPPVAAVASPEPAPEVVAPPVAPVPPPVQDDHRAEYNALMSLLTEVKGLLKQLLAR